MALLGSVPLILVTQIQAAQDHSKLPFTGLGSSKATLKGSDEFLKFFCFTNFNISSVPTMLFHATISVHFTARPALLSMWRAGNHPSGHQAWWLWACCVPSCDWYICRNMDLPIQHWDWDKNTFWLQTECVHLCIPYSHTICTFSGGVPLAIYYSTSILF